jgi:hypothetical protein
MCGRLRWGRGTIKWLEYALVAKAIQYGTENGGQPEKPFVSEFVAVGFQTQLPVPTVLRVPDYAEDLTSITLA